MSITSAQITRRLKESPNPDELRQSIFESARYFVAQEPASDDFSDTIEGYYKGRKVIPGPKANPSLSAVLTVSDVFQMEQEYFIRFTDSTTTEGADDSIGQALITVMSNEEADEYEKILSDLKGGNGRVKNIPRKTAK